MPIPLSKYSHLPTERSNPRTWNLDRIGVLSVLRKINAEDSAVPAAVSRVIPQMAKAVGLMAKAYGEGHKFIFAGAGTSGRLGVLEAAECPPTFRVPRSRIAALMAGGRSSVFEAGEGAEDSAAKGAAAVLKIADKGDVVIGIAASGVTPWVAGALKAARKKGCAAILVTCNAKTGIKGADVVIAPRTGPEVLSGSTRLKSGTATKLVLNSLTTATMACVGKIYRNWMVDLKPASRKLKARAAHITALIGGVGPSKANALLSIAGWDVKTAIVMARLGLGLKEAKRRLKHARGFLKDVIE